MKNDSKIYYALVTLNKSIVGHIRIHGLVKAKNKSQAIHIIKRTIHKNYPDVVVVRKCFIKEAYYIIGHSMNFCLLKGKPEKTQINFLDRW